MCARVCVCRCVRACLLATLTVCMFMDDSLLLTWRSLEKHSDPHGERHQQETEKREVKGGKNTSSAKEGRFSFCWSDFGCIG